MTGKYQADLPDRRFGWLVLFATLPTLFCCALPIAFVALGFGASWAALYSSLPVIGLVAGNKIWFFAISAVLILLASWLTFRPGQTCPSDPHLAALCTRAHIWNRRLVIASALIWGIGFFAAYLSAPLLVWLG